MPYIIVSSALKKQHLEEKDTSSAVSMQGFDSSLWVGWSGQLSCILY